MDFDTDTGVGDSLPSMQNPAVRFHPSHNLQELLDIDETEEEMNPIINTNKHI